MDSNQDLVKNQWGFYQYKNQPSESSLQEYYRDKYYQEGRGSYQVAYSSEEIKWLRFRAEVIMKNCQELLPRDGLTVLDVGCGEGWLMDAFHKAGHTVSGIDYSSAGIHKFHPHLESHLFQGDIYKHLDDLRGERVTYDILTCCNVVEHVLDPFALVQKLKHLIKNDGVLVIMVPNDFSALHEYLMANKHIDKSWWLCYPDHLSYFNKDGMAEFMNASGFKIDIISGDNPIDLNLMNDNSNYVKDPSRGKATHQFRVRSDNFLASIDQDKLIQIYKLLGSMGVGRNLAYFARIVEA